MKHLVSTLLNLAVRSVTRLRRMVDGTLGVDHEVSSVLAKRGPDERPASSLSYSRSTSASSTRSLCQPPVGAVAGPPVQHGQGHHEKRHVWHVPPSQGTNFIRALPVQSPQKVVFTVAFCANLGARLAHAKLKRSKLAR